MEYKWNCVSYKNVDANKVGKELEIINNGELTNKLILEYARNHKKSELNKCFEWDDKKAGEKYRLSQANNILQSISIVVPEQEEPIKAYVNVKTSEDNKVFKPIKVVLNNPDEYSQVVSRAEKEFINYKNKYDRLLELQDLKDIVIRNL